VGPLYNTIILDFPEEGFVAVMPDLPGCSAFGETREESLKVIAVFFIMRFSPPTASLISYER
jgi:hypothetical protein